MPTFEFASRDVSDLASQIMSEHYPELRELQLSHSEQAQSLRVDYLFVSADLDTEGHPKGPAIKHQGYPALGLCRIINLRDRAKGMADVEIQLDKSHWGDIGDEERAALLGHEIHHILPRVDQDGVVKRDDLGRVMVKLRKHDYNFGWFREIAMRHGDASQERQQARSIFNRDGEAFFPFMLDVSTKSQTERIEDALSVPPPVSKLASMATSVEISAGGEKLFSGTGEEFSAAAKRVKVFVHGKAKEFATDEEAVDEIIAGAAKAFGKPVPKKRAPFVQPPGAVNVAGKDEHYLILDLSGVETEAGIRAEFKVAYRRAKWDRLSVGEVVKLLDGLPAEGMKSVLSLYTYQPEAANV